jgi:ABC-type proline/glycine betaine transport system ATPase subunit
VIEFRAVTKRFDDGTIAVNHLDLAVEAGTITVFVGPSGCGKTTSLRMVNRMIDPTSGTVLVDGKDVLAVDPPTLRRGIGYVIQQAGLFPHRTVLDNVATVPLLSGWTRRKARTRAGELLELVGLPAELGQRYPVQLSGGQQQRVGVARALAADPPVLLMDEPFSAVDPVVREGLQDELLRLQAELDKTILFVTHDIDEAVRIGEKVAVFREGGILAQYAQPAVTAVCPLWTQLGLKCALCQRLSSATRSNRRPSGGSSWTSASTRAAGFGRRPLWTVRSRKTCCCPVVRCTSWASRSAARWTRRCRRPPGSAWSSTPTARSRVWSRRTRCSP